MRTLGIIPARAGSQRIRHKNLRLIGGKPLVARAIELAQAACCLDQLIVSSDDPAALDIARRYDPQIALARPVPLATSLSPAIDYVRHALATLEAKTGAGEIEPFEIVVILQPTCPLTLPEDVNATVELLKRSGAGSAVSVVELDHAIHPIKLKTMQGDRLLPYLEEEQGRMAREQLPQLFVRNCAVYATRRAAIDRGEIVTADCRGYVMPRERSIDVNEEIDLAFAEFLLQQASFKMATA